MQSYNVLEVTKHPTVTFAAAELRRCLGELTGDQVGKGDGIRVGLFSVFAEIDAPSVPDPAVDDAVYIDVRGTKGIVAGVNPRSVLLAVYRYLTELGCRWVRPGPDGEYVPRLESLPDVKISETPSYRHRGICIEGAVSEEHVRDIIDWSAKVGFNAYFTQFREAHTFFDAWYSHSNNPFLKGEHISVEEARAHTAAVVAEIKKRDMLYHAVGHGWTCEPFGMPGTGWSTYEEVLPPEIVHYLAEVKGKRQLWNKTPLNTNLCYGNPKARRILVEEIARYAEAHPEIDILHFWLADDSNNNCECELCRDTRPSDFYVMMLNELAAVLKERRLPTRIVFLIYVDLLWPPEHEKIEDPDRFILMFAPICRNYSTSFADAEAPSEMQPFVRNKLPMPVSVEGNLSYLRGWQRDFKGDSFDFDYHLMWHHNKDLGFTQIAQVLSKDIKSLADIGLNGFVSCQVQRAFFPTGLPMTVMGRTLWDRSLSLDAISADYFDAAYGPDGRLVRSYLEKITELFDTDYLKGEKKAVGKTAAKRLAGIPAFVDKFRPVIERNLNSDNRCWRQSWEYLRHHASICILLAKACEARANGDQNAAADAWDQTKRYVQENEMQLHRVLDVGNFAGVLSGLFRY